MKKRISELKQEKAALVAEGRALLDSVEKETRSINSEEASKYEAITEKIDGVEATIKVEEDQEERQRSLARAEVVKEDKENADKPTDYDKAFRSYLRADPGDDER